MKIRNTDLLLELVEWLLKDADAKQRFCVRLDRPPADVERELHSAAADLLLPAVGKSKAAGSGRIQLRQGLWVTLRPVADPGYVRALERGESARQLNDTFRAVMRVLLVCGVLDGEPVPVNLGEARQVLAEKLTADEIARILAAGP